MSRLDENLGGVGFDNLIADSYPPTAPRQPERQTPYSRIRWTPETPQRAKRCPVLHTAPGISTPTG